MTCMLLNLPASESPKVLSSSLPQGPRGKVHIGVAHLLINAMPPSATHAVLLWLASFLSHVAIALPVLLCTLYRL